MVLGFGKHDCFVQICTFHVIPGMGLCEAPKQGTLQRPQEGFTKHPGGSSKNLGKGLMSPLGTSYSTKARGL